MTPTQFLRRALQEHLEGGPILKALDDYFDIYGHQGYSLDFIEPTQAEDPSATFATLKSMVQNANYDPKNQEVRATVVRERKFAEVSEKLSGLTYWQFRYRLWFGTPVQPHPRRDGVLFRLHLVRAATDGVRAGAASGRCGDFFGTGRHVLRRDRRVETGHRGAQDG